MAEDNELLAQLKKDYCPPLDITTFLAILSDYDIKDSKQLQAAHQSLGIIAESVEAEEATGFDPSGSSGRDENGIPYLMAGSDSGHSQLGWSSSTDGTSLSQALSAFDLESLGPEAQDDTSDFSLEKDSALINNYNAQLEGLDISSKEAVLGQTFPGIKPFDIKWTLRKCKGNAGLAVDELLHQVFLEDNGLGHKGIDAFSESDSHSRPRKGKGKKKTHSKLSKAADPVECETPGPVQPVNKWDTARDDIDFISSRTNIPPHQVSSMYHKNSTSLPATINAIIEAELALEIETDATTKRHAQELLQDFPTIPYPHLVALIQITQPSTTAAHELAKALTPRPQPTGGIKIEFRLQPPDVSNSLSKTKPKSQNAVFTSDDPSPSLPYLAPSLSQNPQRLLALRDEAFTHAAASYRRGKSDPLMSSAAAHYASLGRSYDSAAKSALSSAADELVAKQSSRNTLDLHGVNVKDAIRIAREAVGNWWVATQSGTVLGDAGRGRGQRRGGLEDGVHEGFTIITGKGTHSKGGQGKLGPAVFSSLVREGWKVEARSGTLVVVGVVGGR